MEKLDVRIRNHDREIEKMCNHHFQGFVDSITELLKVRGEAQKLKVRREGGVLCGRRTHKLTETRKLTSQTMIPDSDNFLFASFLSQSQVIETNKRLQDDGKEVIWGLKMLAWFDSCWVCDFFSCFLSLLSAYWLHGGAETMSGATKKHLYHHRQTDTLPTR